MENSARIAENRLASIRSRNHAQVNKMMAALGANEEAAQQVVLDAKFENEILKKDNELLQIQKTNLLEKLEKLRGMHENAEREIEELRLKLEHCSDELALARREKHSSYQMMEASQKQLDMAEQEATQFRLSCRKK